MTSQEILKKLKKLVNPKNVAGMARFGIVAKKVYGVAHPDLYKIAKRVGKNHKLAQELWLSGVHEAKIIAGLIDEPDLITDGQLEKWVRDFDSWGVCDSVCLHLFWQYKDAYKKCRQWSAEKEEYIRRAGFALMACLALKDKQAEDKKFIQFFPLIKKYATDERNYVRKAVNWALRQIGKRNLVLNKAAIKEAKEISKIGNKAARWIAGDALRELEGEAVQKRIRSKKYAR